MWLKGLAVGDTDSPSWIWEDLRAEDGLVPQTSLVSHRAIWLAGPAASLRATRRREGRPEGTAPISHAGLDGSGGSIAHNIPEDPRGCIFRATDTINQEISLIPELPQMPFDLIIHNHRQ